MRPEQESRKRHTRFVLPVTRSANMSVCFFQAGKVLSSFFLFPMNNCMKSSAVWSPVIGDLLPERLNWKPYFPGMYPAWHAKEQISEICSKSIMTNILTAISFLLSNGLSLNTDFTLRLSVMSSTMPLTRCISILPGDRLEVVDEMMARRRKPEHSLRTSVQSLYLQQSRIVATQGRSDKGMQESHALFWKCSGNYYLDNLKSAATSLSSMKILSPSRNITAVPYPWPVYVTPRIRLWLKIS